MNAVMESEQRPVLGKHSLWVGDYNAFVPMSHKDAHWGTGQCGFNLSMSGRIFLSDNKRIRLSRATEGTNIDREWFYPCHRDMEDGTGEDKTCLSGIYTFSGTPILWLYPLAERYLGSKIKAGLGSLVGVHRITGQTEVRSNTSRKVLFLLADVRGGAASVLPK